MSGPPSDPHVQSVAVIAAWCESPAHLSQPPVEEALQAAPFRQLCQFVARNWDHTEPLSPALRAELEAQAQQAAAATEAAQRRPRLTAAEISQRSVDLLLREYYQMMQAKHNTGTRQSADASGPGGLSQLFLLICPAGPECCSLSSIAAAVIWTMHAAASTVVVLACLLIPLWLAATRHLLLQQQTGLGAAVAAAGLGLFLAADAVHRSAAAKRRAAAAVVVTASTLHRAVPGVAESGELRALALAASTSKKNASMAGRSSAAQQQQDPAAAAAAAGSSSGAATPGAAGSSPSFLSLIPDVSRLQSVLGISSGEPPTSRERLQQDITRLCQVMGLPVTPDRLATPAAMAVLLAELKSSIGI